MSVVKLNQCTFAIASVVCLSRSPSRRYAASTKMCLKDGKSKKEQVHLIIRDNASMVKAMREAAYPDLGCFAHTLQLIIHNGVLT